MGQRKRDMCAQDYEYMRQIKLDKINQNLLDCYNKLVAGENVDILIRSHKKFINKMQMNGKNKNKYKTVNFFIHYKDTKDKTTAMRLLTCCLNNRGIFKLR